MSMKRIHAPTPAPADAGIDSPNCVNSITEIAADTTAMQRSTKPSRHLGWRFASSTGSDLAAVSPAGGPAVAGAVEGFDSSCLLIAFYAANRFVSDQLRRPRKREAMQHP
jgi:hypothetical protein